MSVFDEPWQRPLAGEAEKQHYPPPLTQQSSTSLGHVLAAYAEAYISGRSVLFIGDVDSGVPQRLLQLGARSVHAYDGDAARARGAAQRSPRAVVVRPLPHTFEVRDGAFDAAIVADMTASPDPEKLARELARLITTDGLVLAATANADATGDTTRAIPYESFYDMFAVCFGFVRVAAKIPWRGVALAELGQGDNEPAVSVDSQLAPEPPTPEHFVIAASHEAAELDTYALFQLPLEEQPSEEDLANEAAERVRQSEAAREAEVEGERRISVQAAASARAEVMGAMAAELAEARLRADVLGTQLSESRAQSNRLGGYEQHLRDEREKNKRQAEELLRAAATIAAAEQRVIVAQREVVDAEKRATTRLQHLEQSIEKHAEEHAHELAQAEQRLRERASVVAELEREIVRRERIVRELVQSLEDARPQSPEPATAAESKFKASQTVEPPPMAEAGPPDAELEAARQSVRAMAMEIARYEGELLARDWRIAELEQNLAIADSAAMLAAGPAGPAGPAGKEGGAGAATQARITDLEREIDTLRRALAQEHEDKKRIESGLGLDELRAALAEKMALIEQMSAQREGRVSGAGAR